MPRILKRPMFSRGGTTKKNNGIMTGLVDRTELSVGSSPFSKERTSADVKAMMDAMNEYAPVTKQRLNYGKVGLDLASGKYSGGDLISTLAGAGSDIYDDFTTKDDAYRAALAKRKQAAVSSSLAQQLKEASVKPKDARTNLMKELEAVYGKDSPEYKAALEKLVLKDLKPKDARTKLMKELEAAGFPKGSPEYEAAIKASIFKESKTTAEKNAEALGLTKGSPEYDQYIKDATYITNAAMERDIQSGGMVIGKAARDKIVQNQSFVKTVRTNLDEVNDLLIKDQSLGGAPGFLRKIANKLGTAAEGFGVDVKAFMPKGLEDKVFDTEIARLSALEALLAPAYARVLFPNQRMTNFLVQEAQDKMNLTGLSGTEEVLARLGEITNQFDIYIKKNEVLLGNQPVYKDDIKKFKIVDGKLVEIVE